MATTNNTNPGTRMTNLTTTDREEIANQLAASIAAAPAIMNEYTGKLCMDSAGSRLRIAVWSSDDGQVVRVYVRESSGGLLVGHLCIAVDGHVSADVVGSGGSWWYAQVLRQAVEAHMAARADALQRVADTLNAEDATTDKSADYNRYERALHLGWNSTPAFTPDDDRQDREDPEAAHTIFFAEGALTVDGGRWAPVSSS